MNENKWRVPGMATALYGHQVIAAGMMINLEKRDSTNNIKGGILADEMGLGSKCLILVLHFCASCWRIFPALHSRTEKEQEGEGQIAHCSQSWALRADGARSTQACR